ncbi:type II secretion system protein GspD [Candidatus Riflebacteria bacterium]
MQRKYLTSLLFLIIFCLHLPGIYLVITRNRLKAAGFDWAGFVNDVEEEAGVKKDIQKTAGEMSTAGQEYVQALKKTLNAKTPYSPLPLRIKKQQIQDTKFSRDTILTTKNASEPVFIRRSGLKDIKITPAGEIRLPDEVNFPVTLDVINADVISILKLYAKHLEKLPGNKSYSSLFGDGLSGKTMTVTWINVPLEDAINIILKENGMIVEKEGPVLRFITKENASSIQRSFGPFKYTTTAEAKAVVEPLLGGVGRIAVSARNKTITVYAKPEAMERVALAIENMDIAPPEPREDEKIITETVLLKYLDATSLKSLITAQLGSIQATITEFSTNEGVVGAGGAATGRKDILIISANMKDLNTIKELITKLDVQPAQIIIDCQIFEINLDNDDQLGINWDYRIPQPNVTSAGTTDLLTFTQNTGGGSTSVFRYGTLDIQQFTAVLGFLKTKSDAKILSNPVITTLNNQGANITVGTSVPYKTTTVNNGVTSEQTQFAAANITLDVTPSITGDDNVFLNLSPTVSSVLSVTSDGPSLGTRSAQTTVLVKNNHTIVIGGLIKSDKTYSEEKFPLLGDIPFLGTIFRKRNYKITKNELLFFITPHIVRNGKIVHANLKFAPEKPKLYRKATLLNRNDNLFK